MKLKQWILLSLTATSLSACIVAPPHVRYSQENAAQVSIMGPTPPVYVQPAPVYAPPQPIYYQPAPQVYINPWLVPNIGLNFWWGRQWGGGHHR
jgi:hypothetical protein